MGAMSREQYESNPTEFLKGINDLPGKTKGSGKWALLSRRERNLKTSFFGGGPHRKQQGLLHLQWRAALLALMFVVLCGLVAVGATQPVDRWAQVRAHDLASYPLDVTTSLVTVLGGAEITGVITLLWSFIWWQRQGTRGLVPLLLFVGVGIEMVLKYYLPHPGPPSEWARGFHYLAFLHFPAPFSFPSGHALRVAFLVALTNAYVRSPFWRALGWGVVVAVALTRLYLNVHSTSDVVGGILLGLALAAVAAIIVAYTAQKPMIER